MGENVAFPKMSGIAQNFPRSTPAVLFSVFRKLNDPRLVVSFQKFCGVEPLVTVGPSHHHTPSPAAGSDPTPPSSLDNESSLRSVDRRPKRRHVQHTDTDRPTHPINKTEPFTDKDVHHELDDTTDSASGSSTDDETMSNRQHQHSSVKAKNQKHQLDYVVKYKILHHIFEFGASLGNELFYILFFPWWFWNIDGYVGRRVCTFWAIYMYMGQATKDIIKWPRPASPPVIRMEKRYALEYGMPSTHAMVGAGLPFSVLILTYDRYEYPFFLGLVASIIWCGLVCTSRIYLGMHTILDILAGLAYVFGLMLICLPILDTIDHFVLTHPYSPLVCISIGLLLCLCYPTLDRWSTARGDTTLIMSVVVGLSVGHWVCYQYGFMQRATTPPPYQIIYPTWTWFGMMLLRLIFGVTILIGTRTIMRLISYNAVCYLFGISKEDQNSHQKLSIELPYKFLTYSVVAFNTVCLAPPLFRYLGIERETFFTEI